MHSLAAKLSEDVLSRRHVLVVAHIDADGITAGSIAASSLNDADIDHDVIFVRSLEEETVNDIKDRGAGFVWFTDIGAGSYDLISDLEGIITDHHVPSEAFSSRKSLTMKESNGPKMLNPHIFGLDGSLDISGAGTTYLVGREVTRNSGHLAGLAVVGSVGDMQDRSHGRLMGSNRKILKEAVSNGLVRAEIDISFFGRETRPISKLLTYSSDPLLPGLTGDSTGCREFLEGIGIELKSNGEWRHWADLAKPEKKTVVSALVKLLLKSGFGHQQAKRLVGECYTLIREERRTVLRDAKEFATLLNSCGRYERARTGLEICLGDRDDSLEEALNLLRVHREYLVESLEIAEEMGIIQMDNLQYFHGGSRIRDTVVGITTGLLMSSPEVDKSIPLFGFAHSENGVKVSARGTKDLVSRGLDLSIVMSKVAGQLGGAGGGHNIAAGATIPHSSEEEFLEAAQSIIRDQMS